MGGGETIAAVALRGWWKSENTQAPSSTLLLGEHKNTSDVEYKLQAEKHNIWNTRDQRSQGDGQAGPPGEALAAPLKARDPLVEPGEPRLTGDIPYSG